MQVENLSFDRKVELSSKEWEPIVVVCAADNNYAMPLAVTLRSAIENLKNNRKVSFFIIDGGLTAVNKQKIINSLKLERCEIEFISISSFLLKKIEEAHKFIELEHKTIKARYVSIASFYRIIIPELLSYKFKKAIYLDSDVVVRGDLEKLWQIDIQENYVLAAQDTWIPYVSSPTSNLNYQELALEPDSKYFNAGVLVINLKKWREDRLCTKAIEYFQQNLKHIGWYDQGVLNALLAGQWGELDPRWNMSPTSVYGFSSWQESPFSEEVYNNLVRDPYIVHFVSNKKPWNSRHTLLKEYFFEYVDMTAWLGWRLTIWRQIWLRLICELSTSIQRISY